MQVRRVNVGCKRNDTAMPVLSATGVGNLVYASGHVGRPLATKEAPTGIGIKMIAALPDSAAQSPTDTPGG